MIDFHFKSIGVFTAGCLFSAACFAWVANDYLSTPRYTFDINPDFANSLGKATLSKDYRSLVEQRVPCKENGLVCNWEVAEILNAWLTDKTAKQDPIFNSSFMFSVIRMTLDNGDGRYYPISGLQSYYAGILPNSRPDQELLECWTRRGFSQNPTSVYECDGLELEKFGVVNPWLLKTAN
jgi:hypothetical protein